MKKTLLFIGLALASTVALAQVQMTPLKSIKVAPQQPAEKALSVDYKASIFTKDIDTIGVMHFGVADTSSLVFGRKGVIKRGQYIDGVLADVHDATNDASVIDWLEGVDTSILLSQAVRNKYENFYTYNAAGQLTGGEWEGLATYMIDSNMYKLRDSMGPAPEASWRGLMVISFEEEAPINTINAYVELPAYGDNIANRYGLIDVTFNQYHAKYYDKEYIDYQINGQWHSREINVTGVDANINYLSSYVCRYSMPLALTAEPSVKLRFRAYSEGNSGLQTKGYFWAIDDVVVRGRSGDDLRVWTARTEYYSASNYGWIPQGMQIPVTWHASVENQGAANLTGNKVIVSHVDANRSVATQLKSVNQVDLAPEARANFEVNDRGFYSSFGDSLGFWNPNSNESLGRTGYFGYNNYYYTSTHPANQAVLPSDVTGKNFVTTTIINGQGDTIQGDTILYNVSDTVQWTVNGVNYKGFRWGLDNGILAGNSRYMYGLHTENGINYLSDSSDSYNQSGYEVDIRLTTGDTVPEGWVFLGVELVPSSWVRPVSGAQVTGTLGIDMYPNYDATDVIPDSLGLSWYILQTGADIKTVQQSDYTGLSTGYMLPGDYPTVFIPYTTQQELTPNTSFTIGYSLSAAASFALARSSYSYPNSNGGNTSFYRDTNTRDYYFQFEQTHPDVRVVENNSYMMAAGYHPMLRAIVGPKVEIPMVHIIADCPAEGDAIFYDPFSSTDRLRSFCGDTIEVAKGNSTKVYFEAPDFYEIDEVIIDGTVRTIYDNDTREGDFYLSREIVTWYETMGTDTIEHKRWRYNYQFSNLQADHEVSVTLKEWDANDYGIKNVDNVKMTLAPNPATSQVRVNIEGVNGTVNCSVIDMSGRVVYTKAINAETSNVINLSNVAAGAYFVRITNSEFSKVEKLIVR